MTMTAPPANATATTDSSASAREPMARAEGADDVARDMIGCSVAGRT